MPTLPRQDLRPREGLSQSRRVARLKTPLGPDVLNAMRFEGTEGLSELFEYTIEVISEKVTLTFDPAIGENCSLVIDGKTTLSRAFCGILVQANWLGTSNDYYIYRLTLRPWLWLLSRTSDCRIFHEQDAPTIIRTVFQDRGFVDFQFRLTESYAKREYCVQYRQTDLDFVLRLMEEEGIYYFFEHSEDRHVLVLVDAKASHRPVVGLPPVMYQARYASGRTDQESIAEINTNRRFQFGKVALKDYDYLNPGDALLTSFASKASHARGELEIYDYPGRYVDEKVGERLAKVRLEAEQATDKRRQATGDVVALFPGALFTLRNHPELSENIEFLVVRCTHRFAAQEYRSTVALEAGEPYTATYELQNAETAFRAPAVTAKPQVMGPQTAKVVGAAGEEIDVDEHGRILVQFHWDRRRDKSRRVRIAQTWSGKKWGSIMIPRIGQEVVVEYLEGDPDQPLVIGTVYNKDMKVPYDLPGDKTKGGVKSNSSKGGDGYNEFVFEDKKNEEEIGLHAQKDLKIVVLNSETKEVGQRFATPVGSPSRKTTLKKGDDELTLSTGSQKVDIAVDQTITVGKKVLIEATMEIQLKVGGTKITLTQGQLTIESPGFMKLKATKIDLN